MTAGASALLILIAGGAATVAAITKGEPRVANAAARDSTIAAAVQPAAPIPPAIGSSAGEAALGAGLGDAGAGVEGRTSDEADRTATRGPRPVATGGREDGSSRGDADAAPEAPGMAAAAPVVTTSTVTETRPIPYRTRLVRDSSLPRGSHRVQTPGIPGEQTLRWLVTRSDGKETGRELIGTTVTREPQHQVIAFGSQGRGWRHRHQRECGPGLDPCLRLRRTDCPDEARAEESAVQLGGSVTVLDKDLALLDPDALELDPGLCPETADGLA
jgi:hypothetical protein